MKSLFNKYFLPGLLVWLPIWATYLIVKFIVNMLDGTLALLPVKYQPKSWLGFHIPGFGVILTLVILFLTGLIATNFFGRQLVALWEKIVSKIPFIRSIHSATKQVVAAFLQPHNNAFRQVLLIEYPRRDIWSLAFKTSDDFPSGPADQNLMTVFVPTTPNPTSGLLTIIPKDQVIEISMSVEDALKMIISLGVIYPGSGTEQKTTEAM